jgi:protein-L-isoaspartate(D-aspartate) O-methyltransferase
MIQPFMATRSEMAADIEKNLGPFDPKHLQALVDVPRERFVPASAIGLCSEDKPVPLDASGLATMSAPHAYLLSFRLLELSRGDSLVELGSGSGYGAALASAIVGAEGRVITIEIDPGLAARSRERLADLANVTVLEGDAVENVGSWGGVRKIVCTFAVRELPDAWLSAIPEGGILVAPVGRFESDQRLVRVDRRGPRLITTNHGAVRYVGNRSPRRTPA